MLDDRIGVQATSIRLQPEGNGYLVETSDGSFEAAKVVLATGGFPRPKIPQASAAIPVKLMQLHSSRYRKPWATSLRRDPLRRLKAIRQPVRRGTSPEWILLPGITLVLQGEIGLVIRYRGRCSLCCISH